ncbi:MAG TPA: hypothetical protein VG844_07890 [Terracidiphilus sp.]|nr:hypothetical protein [Terracidiphilus sp.]
MSLLPLRFRRTHKSDVYFHIAGNQGAKVPEGFHRVVIAEPATGRILHTERTISAGAAEMNGDAYFGAIDYAPSSSATKPSSCPPASPHTTPTTPTA